MPASTPRQWVGYKVHLTETCEDDLPHLITNVETTIGPAADGAATPKIHAALQQRGLLPGTHIVDTGFLDAELLSRESGRLRRGAAGAHRLDYHWQAREGAGFDAQHFQIDWARQQATCPAGKTSIGWTPAVDNRGNAVIKVKFSTKDCRRCDQRRAMCTLEEALSAADAHHPAPAAISGPPSGPATGSDRRVSGGVCPPCRDRRHAFARDTEHTPATHPLHRAGAGASGTSS